MRSWESQTESTRWYRPRSIRLQGVYRQEGTGNDVKITQAGEMSSNELQHRFQPFQDASEEGVGDGVTATT